MEEVLSLEFPITTPEGEVVLVLPQISLTRGLERTFNFSSGNEEGRRLTEEYINYTFEYYMTRKEREETSQSENPERWKEKKEKKEKKRKKRKKIKEKKRKEKKRKEKK